MAEVIKAIAAKLRRVSEVHMIIIEVDSDKRHDPPVLINSILLFQIILGLTQQG